VVEMNMTILLIPIFRFIPFPFIPFSIYSSCVVKPFIPSSISIPFPPPSTTTIWLENQSVSQTHELYISYLSCSTRYPRFPMIHSIFPSCMVPSSVSNANEDSLPSRVCRRFLRPPRHRPSIVPEASSPPSLLPFRFFVAEHDNCDRVLCLDFSDGG